MSILTIRAPFLHKKLCKKAKYIKLIMQFHAKSANAKLSSFSSFTEPDSSLFHRRYSIDAPSILHRWSIVSMEKRWSIDGQAMEEQRNILGRYTKNIQRKILSFIFVQKITYSFFLPIFYYDIN